MASMVRCFSSKNSQHYICGNVLIAFPRPEAYNEFCYG